LALKRRLQAKVSETKSSGQRRFGPSGNTNRPLQ
jgi:hypothetical protein